MTTTVEDVLREYDTKATAAPWTAWPTAEPGRYRVTGPDADVTVCELTGGNAHDDACLIAELRNALPDLLARRAMPTDHGARVGAISKWIDDSYPPDLGGEAHLWRRLMKPVAEIGEAHEALSGMLGENPRKGYAHTRDDVVRELLDVALAALGAVEHMTGNKGESLDLLAAHIDRVYDRAGLPKEPHAD